MLRSIKTEKILEKNIKIDKPNKLEIFSYCCDFITFRKKKPSEVKNTMNAIAKANNNKKFM